MSPPPLRSRVRACVRGALVALVAVTGTAACSLVLGVDDLPPASDDGGATSADGAALLDGTLPPTSDGAAPPDSGGGLDHDASGGDAGAGGDAADGSIALDASSPYLVLTADAGEVGFGRVLAFSPDSQTLAVGAPGKGDGANVIVSGVVDLFGREGSGGWSLAATLHGSSTALGGSSFGTSLAFGVGAQANPRPSILAVGWPEAQAMGAPNVPPGAVLLYDLSDASAPLASVIAPGNTSGFGTSVACARGPQAGSASTVYIGAPGDGGPGAIVSYVPNGDASAPYFGSAVDGGGLGTSVVANLEVPTVLVGAPGVPAAYFGKPPMLAPVSIGDASADGLGTSAAMAPSGLFAVVGAPDEANGTGAVYVYAFTNNMIALFARIPGTAKGDHFGASLAINGTTVAVGSPGVGRGVVSLYSLLQSASGLQTPITTYSAPMLLPGSPLATIGYAVALAVDGTLAIGSDDVGNAGRVVVIAQPP